MTTTADEVWQLLAELVKAQKETERRFQETDLLIQQVSKEVQRVSRDIGNLGGKWGRFVENMVACDSFRSKLGQTYTKETVRAI